LGGLNCAYKGRITSPGRQAYIEPFLYRLNARKLGYIMFQMIDYGVEIKFQFVYVFVERGSEFNEGRLSTLLAQLGKPSRNATTRPLPAELRSR
jgi:hypothetical protein